MSYFSRVNYSYKDRYLASGTLRYDGSSRFGQNNRYGLFPAFSLGWRISEENFINENLEFVDDLKFRFGWGVTGNQEIDNNAIYNIYLNDLPILHMILMELEAVYYHQDINRAKC